MVRRSGFVGSCVLGVVVLGVLAGVRGGQPGERTGDGGIVERLERIERGLFRADSRLVRARDASIERRLDEIEMLIRRLGPGGVGGVDADAIREMGQRLERIEDLIGREVVREVEDVSREVEAIGRRVEGFDRGGLGRAGRTLEDLDRRLERIERRLEAIERRIR